MRPLFVLFLSLPTILSAGCKSADPLDGPGASSSTPPTSESRMIHSLTAKLLDGSESSLSVWAGKVLLIANTASECGFTPQYEGLEALHTKYAARGFSVLGFPSNDFGGQEPGSSQEIATFCKRNYGVTFPMFEKVHVKGSQRHPLYALLAEAKGTPKWNFHKYLIDRRGRPVEAWPSSVEPNSTKIVSAVERELALP